MMRSRIALIGAMLASVIAALGLADGTVWP
jgi:hypothetical protein